MFTKTRCIVSCIAVCVVAQAVTAGSLNVQLKANKSLYICGEPILLKTDITNPSGEDFKGKSPGYGWGADFGFTMDIAFGEDEFTNILHPQVWHGLGVRMVPMGLESFDDRHGLPRSLSVGQAATRLDMLIMSKPGDYKLRALLKDPDGTAYVSEPIQMRVIPMAQKYDSASQLGGQEFLMKLGSSILFGHYMQRFFGAPGKSLKGEEFEQVAAIILDKHKDSIFREYVMYADIMTHYRPDTTTHELINGRKNLAERFVKEYPESWLLPDVYRKLFWTYVAEKDRKKAEQVRNKALEIAPNATVLKEVREFGPVVLKELQQAEAEPVQNKTKP